MKDIDRILRDLRCSGWATVHRTGSGHYKIIPADSSIPAIICPGTSSSKRSILDLKSHLRRGGYKDLT